VNAPRAMADALIAAEQDRRPIVPFTQAQPFLRATAAYEAQSLFVGHRLQAGEQLIGAKLGMTSRAKRDALGIREPVYGRLTSGMVLPFGETLRLDRLIHPVAEPEIAFLLGRPITRITTLAEVMTATEAVFPALEVVDSRYCERFRLPDSVADNAGAARVVLGASGRRPADLVDLHVLGCLFRWPGGCATAAGGAVMGHPAAAVAWLANTLASQGEQLDAGTIVLSGALTAAVPLQAGSVLTAEFDGLGTVGVQCQ
jgi:2-oxo-3-hexenedioate decarboxylase